MFEELIKELQNVPEIVAITLGGSRATNLFDEHSDYDVYVYTTSPILESVRKNIIDQYVSYMEYSNTFWELEDDGILKNGVEIELIYRDISAIESQLLHTVEGHPSTGYTTCFLDNFMNSRTLYEERNMISTLQTKLKSYDWSSMFDTVIIQNNKLLRDAGPSLFYQIEKAVKRGDLVSINHRLSAYLELVFDILFALNQTLHPGEKRLLDYADNLTIKPKKFRQKVEAIFQNAYTQPSNMLLLLDKLTKDLYHTIQEEGYPIHYNTYEKAKIKKTINK